MCEQFMGQFSSFLWLMGGGDTQKFILPKTFHNNFLTESPGFFLKSKGRKNKEKCSAHFTGRQVTNRFVPPSWKFFTIKFPSGRYILNLNFKVKFYTFFYFHLKILSITENRTQHLSIHIRRLQTTQSGGENFSKLW